MKALADVLSAVSGLLIGWLVFIAVAIASLSFVGLAVMLLEFLFGPGS